MVRRKSFHQLPTGNELDAIIVREAQRPLSPGQEARHYVSFGTVVRMFETLGIDASAFTRPFPPGGFTPLLDEAERVLEAVLRVLLAGATPKQEARCREFYAYLSEEDPLQPAEALFVFGAKSLIRIEKAVELYRQGLAPLLVLSGRSPAYLQEFSQAEAERDRDYAIAQGVPAAAIVVEPEAITLADNVRRSLNLLDVRGPLPKSFLLVNSPYVQRRGWGFFSKFVPLGTAVRRVNSPTAPMYSAGGWFTNEQGIRTVLNEAFKLKVAYELNTA